MNLVSPDIPGLVWAYRFRPGEGAARIPSDAPISAIAPGEGWVWVHLALSDSRTPTLLERVCDMPRPALTTLVSADTQASILVEDGVVFGTLVDFERTFDELTKTIGWLHFAVSERMIVTTRLHPLRSIDRARQALEKNLLTEPVAPTFSPAPLSFATTEEWSDECAEEFEKNCQSVAPAPLIASLDLQAQFRQLMSCR